MTKLHLLAEKIGAVLKERGESVAVSESSSGGLVSASLLAVPGASTYFMGGVVIYTSAAREALLDINLADKPDIRSSTEAYALLTAQAVRERLDTTWGISETGAAGPGGNRYGDLPGHTCVAVAGRLEHSETLETGLTDRSVNMKLFAEKILLIFDDLLHSSG